VTVKVEDGNRMRLFALHPMNLHRSRRLPLHRLILTGQLSRLGSCWFFVEQLRFRWMKSLP
jgi:hypothetical protein